MITTKLLITEREDGSWLVDGATPIDEIHLSIGLEDISANASYETIAGFVLHTMGRTPEAGEFIERYLNPCFTWPLCLSTF